MFAGSHLPSGDLRCTILGEDVRIDNMTISNSPFWTLHFQYCDNITVSRTTVFNPNNGSIEAPNGDGIDVDSSSNVHVHDCLLDVADDELCCKSGADWLGRQVGMPTKNVLFEDCEVRNGHGLTLGSEASGGMFNVTYRGIFLNGMGGPQVTQNDVPNPILWIENGNIRSKGNIMVWRFPSLDCPISIRSRANDFRRPCHSFPFDPQDWISDNIKSIDLMASIKSFGYLHA